MVLPKIDVRGVPVDKLATFSSEQLAARKAKIVALISAYESCVEDARKHQEKAEKGYTFVQQELVNVELAQQLAQGNVVRVICSTCRGTGLKPADVLSGQIAQRGSAFEGVGGAAAAPVIDERNRCPVCKGLRWQIMERFKG